MQLIGSLQHFKLTKYQQNKRDILQKTGSKLDQLFSIRFNPLNQLNSFKFSIKMFLIESAIECNQKNQKFISFELIKYQQNKEDILQQTKLKLDQLFRIRFNILIQFNSFKFGVKMFLVDSIIEYNSLKDDYLDQLNISKIKTTFFSRRYQNQTKLLMFVSTHQINLFFQIWCQNLHCRVNY